MKKLTTKEFIKRSRLKHDNFYNYSKSIYINKRTKVEIICPIHGSFFQLPESHYNRGDGCPICAIKNKTKTTEQFIKEAKKIYGDKYNYSKINYINTDTKVEIICPIHDSFFKRPDSFLSGCGCPECSDKTKTTEEFINEARKIHNNFYDYSLTNYKNAKTKVKIICPIHGVFEQTPNNHLNNQGCPKCNSSKGEIAIREILKENNILFEEQKRFKKLIKFPFDFYLPKKNLLIEYNGIQHYKAIDFFGGEKQLAKQKENDKLKKDFCKTNNLNLLTISYKDNIKEKLYEKIN